MDLLERARLYVAKVPPAVSGQGGHDQTYTVAVALIHRFALSESDALTLLREYSATCQPPWSESELLHKLRQAATKPHTKPRGDLADGATAQPARSNGRSSGNGYPRPKPEEPMLRAPIVEIPDSLELPEPHPDATRQLLRSCFLPGEGVRIVEAVLGDDNRERPNGHGATLLREEWLAKLDVVGGNPNRIWSQKSGAGIYIALNPMLVGTDTDKDVTAYRHTLIEFDSMPIAQCWALYQQTRLPCAAVIHSGGRSLHAWVRVDAKDRTEYDDRTRFLHAYFADHGLDGKNKNPSRLSRLPGCHRFESRQELWALGSGAATWDDWRVEVDLMGELKPLSWTELEQPVSMEDNLLGNRFLERGQGLILYGPAGCGKSVASLQAQVEWAAGERGLHIKPERPLRIVLLQTEDSVNDMRESLAGIMELLPEDLKAKVRKNLILLPAVPGGDEASLARLIDKVATAYKPDIISVNPLLAFCSADPSKNLGTLLYQHVDPAIKHGHVGLIAVHHTPKTNRMDTKGYGAFDHQYLAAGDARVANWPRAMIQIEPIAGSVYLFRCAKRAGRSGWTWDLKPTSERYFSHAKGGVIRWVDATPEQAKEAKAKVESEDYRTLAEALPDGKPVTRERVRDLAKKKLNVAKHKADGWLKLCVEDGLIIEIPTIKNKRMGVDFMRRPPMPETTEPPLETPPAA